MSPEPARRVTRVSACARCVEDGEADRSTDTARWCSREAALALPLLDLAREGLRLAFEPKHPPILDP